VNNEKRITEGKGLLALSPLLVFVMLYLVTSIIARDFYKVPITVAFLAAGIYAIAITKGKLIHRINIFSRGAATAEMMLMIWIFILAGAFANSAKVMGAIDATVNLTISLLPEQMLLAGLFLAACFISLSIGTSVGTIVALRPIAAGVASQTGADLAMVIAIVVGGSFFGDNLSFISDTTIIATQTQGCKTSDKFGVNSFIVAPAALILLAVYFYLGKDVEATSAASSIEFWKVVPYLAVIITAMVGLNVMIVLTLGIILTGIIGLSDGSFTFFGWLGAMGDGIMSMGELIIITMLAGGLLQMIKHNGGINFIISRLTSHVNSKRGGELVIALLVSIVNLCTANNTVAIITVGGIARNIGQQFKIDPRKCASLLDTFSCAVQGLLPYGAQILMAAGLASINPIAIVPRLYYPMAIGVAALLAILFRYPRRYS
jgi:Na+/H+ antiporter NhaC